LHKKPKAEVHMGQNADGRRRRRRRRLLLFSV
jgi:hypothetical protein